eukprot:1901810-Prymnesium_polylepis.2
MLFAPSAAAASATVSWLRVIVLSVAPKSIAVVSSTSWGGEGGRGRGGFGGMRNGGSGNKYQGGVGGGGGCGRTAATYHGAVRMGGGGGTVGGSDGGRGIRLRCGCFSENDTSSTEQLPQSPLSHFKSSEFQRETTSACLPMENSVSLSALAGSAPLGRLAGGLPASLASKAVTSLPPCASVTTNAPLSASTEVRTSNGKLVSMRLPGP